MRNHAEILLNEETLITIVYFTCSITHYFVGICVLINNFY